MKRSPRAVKEMPRSVLPFALLGGRYMHEAEALAALGVPLNLADPIEPAHATALGLIAAPPALTRTVAVTVDPAFGRASVTRAGPADGGAPEWAVEAAVPLH